MRYDQDTLETIARHLQERWPAPRTCPVCRQKPEHWRISETPVLLPLLTGTSDFNMRDLKNAADQLSAAPVIAATCAICGHVLLFNAAHMNVLPMRDSARGRFTIPSD